MSMLPAVAAIGSLFAQPMQQQRVFDNNRKLAELQNKYNMDMFTAVNQYNDPMNQLARMKRAGVNPDLAWSKGGLQNVSAPAPVMTAGTPMSEYDAGAAVRGAVDTVVGALDKLQDVNRKETENARLREQIDLQIKTTAKEYEMLVEEYRAFQQEAGARVDEAIVRQTLANAKKSALTGTYFDNDQEITGHDVLVQMFGKEMYNQLDEQSKQSSQIKFDKAKLDKLFGQLDALVKGESDASKLIGVNLDRAQWDLKQEKFASELLEKLTGSGDAARFLRTLLKLLFGKFISK